MTDAQSTHWPRSLAERMTQSLLALLKRKADDPGEQQPTRDACRVILGDSLRMARLAECAAGLYAADRTDGDAERTPSPQAIDDWCRLKSTWAGGRDRAETGLCAKVLSISNGS